MEHIAIMKKSWGFTQKILSGQKKIESRWYTVKRDPWNNIKSGEVVYFKDSGSPVTVKAEVENVLQFSDVTPNIVKEILIQYGQNIGIDLDKINERVKMFKDKKYCILIFITNPQKIKPFKINKSGFGAMSAWIAVEMVKDIIINE